MELTGSLDYERGGEISLKLAQLYGYMTRMLIEANCQQNDAPLSEVLGLLSTLSEAWDGLKGEQPEPAVSAGPWAHTMSQEPGSTYASQAWSL